MPHTVQKAFRDKTTPPPPILNNRVSQDPLVSLSVRVRWAELREGLVEESQHYTTLDPLPEETIGRATSSATAVGGSVRWGGSGGQWFVSPT